MPTTAVQKAGRELDAAVAEKVMGCTVIRGDFGWLKCGDGVTCAYPHASRDRDDQLSGELARYSTDIAAATTVTERLREHRITVYWRPETQKWQVMIARRPLSHDPFQLTLANVTAPTLPLAICLAALEAISFRRAE